jgi:hypothetical protein
VLNYARAAQDRLDYLIWCAPHNMSDGAISHLAHEVQCVFRLIILVLLAHPDS